MEMRVLIIVKNNVTLDDWVLQHKNAQMDLVLKDFKAYLNVRWMYE